MIRNATVLCISNVDWNFLWQRHQILMTKFAADGNQVLFLENLGIRTPALQDVSRVISRLSRIWAARSEHSRQGNRSIRVVSPLILPPANTAVFRILNKYWLVPRLCLTIKPYLRSPTIIWTYLGTAPVLEIIKRTPHQALIYDCVNNNLAHPAAPSDLAETEVRLLSAADLVFTDSSFLRDQKRSQFERAVMQIPPGVDESMLSRLDESPPIPDDLKIIPRPRLTYFGTIDNRMDWDAIRFILASRQNWSIVLIGPVKDNSMPPKIPNLHHLGMKRHEQLASYLKHSDILIIPYLKSPFTKAIMPAKLFECFATGKPLMVSGLQELSDWDEDLIFQASTLESWVTLAEVALEEPAEKARARIELAAKNTWQSRYTKITELLAPLLASSHTDPSARQ